MRVTLLGTGTSQGVPVIGCNCEVCRSNNLKDKRLRTSALLEWNHTKFVIDCGPDFRTQMLRENIDRINGIFFTHEHADHTAGLDDIRPLYFKTGIPIPIYAQQRVIDDLKKRFDYIFTQENRYPGAPEVAPFVPKLYRSYFIEGKEIMPLEIRHGNLPIYAYKIDNFAYITDAKFIPQPTKDILKNIDVLVVNALHHKSHKMHMNLQETLEFIDEIKPGKAILTHISHHMGLYDEMQKQLPGNVFLGYDGMVIEVQKN